MQDETPMHRPGDLFLDRYMSKATNEEREAAYENLRCLIAILIEIDDRLAREKCGQSDSLESQSRGTFESPV